MPDVSFAQMLLQHPNKAARMQARRRVRIGELRRRPQVFAVRTQLEELERAFERYEQAFVETARCSECGRELTDPASIARGVGGDCWSDLLRAAHEELAVRSMAFHRTPAPEDDF
ncbi:MAG: DUF6011 domain-containing protein [Acidimicrobiia bacterium]